MVDLIPIAENSPSLKLSSVQVPEYDASPLFILAAPRSFTSIVCAVLGQHPQMHGLPELHLFNSESVAGWWKMSDNATFPRADGMLRTIAQLFFGGQTEETVRLSQGWLRRRSYLTTGALLELISQKVCPRIVVEKSSSVVYRVEFLRRAHRMFPGARFLHLLRHPRSQGESVMKYMEMRRQLGRIPPNHWLFRISTRRQRWDLDDAPAVDPQRGWCELNQNILHFLETIPQQQKMQVRSEDLLTDLDGVLMSIAQWLGIRTDADALDCCKYPERSPYACLGPKGAVYGNDRFFLENPVLRTQQAKPCALEGSLSWRNDGEGFAAPVKRLARQFGYS